jgi:hypothetical protein
VLILCKSIYLALVAIWVFVAICITSQTAHAYVDPGSGLFVLQVVGSTFLGFAYLVRKRVSQIFGLLSKNQKATRRDIAAH